MDILITRPTEAGAFDVLLLDRTLRAACPKVAAVTVAHHCDPYAVFVHVKEDLTPEERQAIEAVVQSHKATGS